MICPPALTSMRFAGAHSARLHGACGARSMHARGALRKPSAPRSPSARRPCAERSAASSLTASHVAKQTADGIPASVISRRLRARSGPTAPDGNNKTSMSSNAQRTTSCSRFALGVGEDVGDPHGFLRRPHITRRIDGCRHSQFKCSETVHASAIRIQSACRHNKSFREDEASQHYEAKLAFNSRRKAGNSLTRYALKPWNSTSQRPSYS